MNRARDLILVLAFAGALYLLPDVLRALYGQASVSYLSLATNAASLAILALSWDLLARTGQLSLAHAAFFGVGAYATAVLARHTEMSLWWGLPVAAAVAVLLALAIGSVTLRLKGIYFAIATLAFTEVTKAVARHLPTGWAGGSAGLNVPALFRPTFVPGEMERWEIAFLRNEAYFFVYAGLLLVTVLLSLLVQRSRLRMAFTAVRTNERVASVMGVRPARAKLLAFALSSMMVGMLGAVAAHRTGSVIPEGTFAITTTVFALVTPIFGGLYTTLGPIVGAGVLSGVEEVLRRTLDEGYLVGYGVVLVLSILFLPRGLVGWARERWAQRRARTTAPDDPEGSAP